MACVLFRQKFPYYNRSATPDVMPTIMLFTYIIGLACVTARLENDFFDFDAVEITIIIYYLNCRFEFTHMSDISLTSVYLLKPPSE